MRDAFVNTLYDLAHLNKDIILLTGDIGFGVLNKFWEQYPSQFINAGISEQNMTSMAAGMALEGKMVFTYSIANFPTLRCLEQIRNDVCYHNANVKIVSVGAGLSYGTSGMSHHATEDIAIMRALPNIIVFTPCDSYEVSCVTKLATEINKPCYIRLGRGGEAKIHKEHSDIKLGKACLLKSGEDTAIFVAGSIINEALKAAEILSQKGISCAVYSFPSIKPIDEDLILNISSKVQNIFTLEEHNIMGGFGSIICEVIASTKSRARIIRLGINDVYTSVVGSTAYLKSYYELSAEHISKRIYEELNN